MLLQKIVQLQQLSVRHCCHISCYCFFLVCLWICWKLALQNL